MKTLFGWLMALVLAVSSGASVAKSQEVVPFAQAELDQMLAPIALYPDQLLSQILMAATYPLEVVQAARFLRDNPDLHGQDAVRAAEGRDWDPSVQSLLAFPNVLEQMEADLDWTERLGDAFLAQQQQVMDTVQALRNRAYAAGNLRSNDKVRVVREREVIVVRPVRQDLVYVPYYDPLTIYGSWWWPQYRPVTWGPWPGYGLASGYSNFSGFYWGSGISLGVNFFFGDWDWPTHRVRVVPHRPFYYRRPPPVHHVWVHDYQHRRGHRYPNRAVEHRYVPTDARPVYRHDYGERRGDHDGFRYGNHDRGRADEHEHDRVPEHDPQFRSERTQRLRSDHRDPDHRRDRNTWRSHDTREDAVRPHGLLQGRQHSGGMLHSGSESRDDRVRERIHRSHETNPAADAALPQRHTDGADGHREARERLLQGTQQWTQPRAETIRPRHERIQPRQEQPEQVAPPPERTEQHQGRFGRRQWQTSHPAPGDASRAGAYERPAPQAAGIGERTSDDARMQPRAAPRGGLHGWEAGERRGGFRGAERGERSESRGMEGEGRGSFRGSNPQEHGRFRGPESGDRGRFHGAGRGGLRGAGSGEQGPRPDQNP